LHAASLSPADGVRTLARPGGARCFGPVHDRNHPGHGDRRMPAMGWRPGPACLRGAASRVVASGHRRHDRRRCLPARGGPGGDAGKITVREEEMWRGVPGEPCRCPIARAITRVLPESDPWVNPPEVQLYTGTDRFGWAGLPSQAIAFTREFDHYGAAHVEPFE